MHVTLISRVGRVFLPLSRTLRASFVESETQIMYRAALSLGCVVCLAFLEGCGSSEPPPNNAPPVAQSPSSGAPSPGATGGEESYSAPGSEGSGPGGAALAGGADNAAYMPPGSESGLAGSPSGDGFAMFPGSGESNSAGGPPPGYEGYAGAGPGDGFGGGFGAEGSGGNGFGFGAQGNRRVPPKKATLQDRAVAAFQAGNTKRGYTLLQAFAMQSSDEIATELLSKYRWASHLKRPSLGILVAVGATIKNPQNVADLAPIGTDSNAPGGGGIGGGEGMYGPGGGTSGGSNDKKSFAEVTGALGKKLAQAFADKHSDGIWTPAFSEYSLGRSRPGMPGGNESNGGYGPEYGGGDGFEPGGPAGAGFGAAGFGGGGMGAGAVMPFLQPPGGFEGFPGGNPAAPPAFGILAADVQMTAGHSAIAPCMTFIGVEEQSKLIKKAAREGFDCLVIFEVDIKQNRILNKTVNETRMRAVLPKEIAKDVKTIGSSKELNNVQVAKAKASGASDGVDEAVEMIVKKMEENLALSELPAGLTPENISEKRIPALVEDKGMTVVDRLSEVNLYYLKGFIDEMQRADAFEKIAGQLGQSIATGSASEQTKALEKLLEREFK